MTYLTTNLDEQNMLAVYVLGWKYNIEKVCEKAARKISLKFPKLIPQNDDFLRLDLQCLRGLFFSPYLQADEKDICKAVLKWFQFDIENREQHFDEVMTFFCNHIQEDALLYFTTADLYKERNIDKSREEPCGNNPRCTLNGTEPVTTIEELSNLYGDRFIDLPKNIHLMNTFTCSYSEHKGNIPNEMMKIQMCEKSKNSRDDRPFKPDTYPKYKRVPGKVVFADQLRYGDHHVSTFYQDVSNAEHVVVITGNYWVTCGDIENRTLGIFSRLPKVRLICDTNRFDKELKSPPNPRYIHHKDPTKDGDRMYRYPLMLVIGGPEVDMDDAVRFASSLVLNNGGGNCEMCKNGSSLKFVSNHYRFIDIWTPKFEKERAAHFGY